MDEIIAVDGNDVSDNGGRSGRPLGARSCRNAGAADHPPTGRSRATGVHRSPARRSPCRSSTSRSSTGRTARRSATWNSPPSRRNRRVDVGRRGARGVRAAGVQYWILDLRDNAGGYVETLRRSPATSSANGQPVAYYVIEDGDGSRRSTPTAPLRQPAAPFAVLINAGSGSSSEAFAAAAQDYGFARLFGQKTSGCLAAGGRSTWPRLGDQRHGPEGRLAEEARDQPGRRASPIERSRSIHARRQSDPPGRDRLARDPTATKHIATEPNHGNPAACPRPVPGAATMQHPPQSNPAELPPRRLGLAAVVAVARRHILP